MRRLITIALLVCCAAPAWAQAQWTASEQLQGAWELYEGGDPLRRVLFAQGWPTDEDHIRLTDELAARPANELIGASVAPGVGLPITASAFERDRLAALGSRSRVRDVQGLLRQTLSDFRDATGYTGSLPRSFVPSFMPYLRGTTDLEGTYRKGDVASLSRREPPERKLDLESAAWALLAQARLARSQLTQTHGNQLGTDGDSGFTAMLAGHAALATARELHEVVFNGKERELQPQRDVLGLDEFRYYLPTAWDVRLNDDDPPTYEVPGGRAAAVSRLRGQAVMLFALCELSRLTNPEARELSTFHKTLDLSAANHLMVVEVAVFLFKALRSLHVDVRLRRAISEAEGGEIQTIDLGLYLMAMDAFVHRLEYQSGTARADSTSELLKAERGKAVTLISTLSDSLRIWQQQRPDGFYDVYTVRTNSAVTASGESLAANAFAIRGLLASHRALSDGAATSKHLEAACQAAEALDRQRWQTSLSAYTETSASPKAFLRGASSVLGALRELALDTGDGRYLARYRQYLESLSNGDFQVEGSGRTAPHLAAEITFEAGSK